MKHGPRWWLIALGAAALVAAACTPVKKSSPPPETVSFGCVGAAQFWTVPTGVTALVVDAYGAQGGGTATQTQIAGALGGRATAVITVSPGQLIQVDVGCRGGDGTIGNHGSAGLPFGGDGGLPHTTATPNAVGGGGGGGLSQLRRGNERLIVAGGGGGAAFPVAGGGGGGVSGADGGPASPVAIAGKGANGLTPGAGGTPGGTAGFEVNGGDGGDNTGVSAGHGGGGGGAGYAGGGGGAFHSTTSPGGGGGGSGFGPPGTQFQTGVRAGNGVITISYST
jgi:hypothetical protein